MYKRFNEWSKKGKWLSLFKKRVSEPDTEWEFIDGSYVKAHQHSAGASGANNSQAIGSYGLPIEFTVTGGKRIN